MSLFSIDMHHMSLFPKNIHRIRFLDPENHCFQKIYIAPHFSIRDLVDSRGRGNCLFFNDLEVFFLFCWFVQLIQLKYHKKLRLQHALEKVRLQFGLCIDVCLQSCLEHFLVSAPRDTASMIWTPGWRLQRVPCLSQVCGCSDLTQQFQIAASGTKQLLPGFHKIS